MGAKFRWVLLVLLSCTASRQSAAQQRQECSYTACAVAIVPAWNGLEVVRQADGVAIVNLNFFLPRDIGPALAGSNMAVPGADSALMYARRAVGLRRVGALLTDAGGIALAVAAVRALQDGHLDRTNQRIGMGGAAALLVSVPFQFAADGALSRAVWWHNLRYSR